MLPKNLNSQKLANNAAQVDRKKSPSKKET